MTVPPDALGSLDALLDRLVMGAVRDPASDRAGLYQSFAFERAERILRSDLDARERRRFELRLRLALHLAPAEAVAYARSNPTPRWRLIRDHLATTFDRDFALADPLARLVATVLDNWDRNREAVTGHRNFLMRRDGSRCRHCRVEFADFAARSVVARDDYKPYYLAPDELLSPEVDHDEAISAIGTNDLDNLQLLCRLCNGGKGDGLGVDVRQEANYAGRVLNDIPRAHRARMLYYVLERDGRACVRCGSNQAELTMQRVVALGSFVRSNLSTLCVDCAY